MVLNLLEVRLVMNCWENLTGERIGEEAVSNPTVHDTKIIIYTRRITPKCVTSLRCPSPRHIAPRQQLLAKLSKRWRKVCIAV